MLVPGTNSTPCKIVSAELAPLTWKRQMRSLECMFNSKSVNNAESSLLDADLGTINGL